LELGFREATPADSAAIAELTTQLGYPCGIAQAGERLQRLRDAREGAVLVAETEGRVIGWIHVSPQFCLEAAPWAEIRGLVVDAAYRGSGAGIALLRAAEAWARSAGLPLLRLRTNVLRTETHEFYRRRGFRQLKTQHVFAKDLS
jgi:N-acetylglutamate synthase-like GNAT family acetyltransferase